MHPNRADQNEIVAADKGADLNLTSSGSASQTHVILGLVCRSARQRKKSLARFSCGDNIAALGEGRRVATRAGANVQASPARRWQKTKKRAMDGCKAKPLVSIEEAVAGFVIGAPG